jgi:hypothetical protein
MTSTCFDSLTFSVLNKHVRKYFCYSSCRLVEAEEKLSRINYSVFSGISLAVTKAPKL